MKNGVNEKIINRIKKLLKLIESPVLAEAEETASKRFSTSEADGSLFLGG